MGVCVLGGRGCQEGASSKEKGRGVGVGSPPRANGCGGGEGGDAKAACRPGRGGRPTALSGGGLCVAGGRLAPPAAPPPVHLRARPAPVARGRWRMTPPPPPPLRQGAGNVESGAVRTAVLRPPSPPRAVRRAGRGAASAPKRADNFAMRRPSPPAEESPPTTACPLAILVPLPPPVAFVLHPTTPHRECVTLHSRVCGRASPTTRCGVSHLGVRAPNNGGNDGGSTRLRDGPTHPMICPHTCHIHPPTGEAGRAVAQRTEKRDQWGQESVQSRFAHTRGGPRQD